ncbi:MAG: flagellar FliJ family protein [Alphaproteobacteria bacterium]|nr:flagellar FliJ family protein [Alphaproteobacteria bacterium]
MKGIAAMVRVHKWKLEERSRVLQELERLRQKLQQAGAQLEAELVSEQNQARGGGLANLTYGGYAQAVIQRRDHIAKSLAEVAAETEQARKEVAAAFQELKKYELALANREKQKKQKEAKVERTTLDDLGIAAHRRSKTGQV